MAVLHNFDSEGQASVAHTDISPNQYIKVNNIYKLNDFNRARFIPYTTAVSTNSSSNTSTACSYHIGNNPGKNRAPEEYKLEPQSEKVRKLELRKDEATHTTRDAVVSAEKSVFVFV